MRTIGGIFLMLISLFSGGCSLTFLALGVGAGAGVIGGIIALGLLTAAISGYAAVKLLGAVKPDPPPAATFPLWPQNKPKPPEDPDMWR